MKNRKRRERRASAFYTRHDTAPKPDKKFTSTWHQTAYKRAWSGKHTERSQGWKHDPHEKQHNQDFPKIMCKT